MKDEDKTKDELINELVEFRQRIAEIEALETEQKKTEELLRNTERGWRDSFNSLEDVMLIIDKDYNIENINEIGLKLLGKSEEEVIGEKCYQIISGADSPAEECPGKKSLETKQVESLDRYEKRFGRIFSIKSSPILDENGEVMKFVDLMRDITERKKDEEALRESEERLSSFMESATDGFFLLDSELNYVEINKAGFWLFPAGTKKEDIIGKNIVEIAPDIKKTGRYDKYMEVLKTGKPFFVDDMVPHPKFGGVHLALRAFKVGNNLGIISTDITELKGAEEELKEAKSHFETLFNFMVDPVVIVDGKGKILEITNRVREITGFKKDELIGKNFLKTNLLTAKSKAIAIKNLAKRMMGMKIAPYEVEVLTKDGKKISFEINAARIDYRGKPADMVVFRDLTERKKNREELQDTLKKLRGALGATIQAMALTVETRDAYTAGHQRRVTSLARTIATEMKLSKDQIDGIRTAGTIHDIGKIGVPAEILNKPVRLTDIEFNLIKIHSLVGYNILKQIEFPWPVAEIVLQHHERMNGSGYPRGLSDGDILLEARILGVADVVEAMVSHRPYRPALGIDEALEEISQNKGVLYDPQVVDTCLKLFRKKRFKFE